MNVKQFKRRWLNSKVEPELFYMPVKKEEKRKAKLTIQTLLYNTLNLETMEYSNTDGYFGNGVFSHIIVKDSKGSIFFNSKKQQSEYRTNTNPSVSFILNNVPYGIYQIKVIYAYNGGIVDNVFHEIIVDNEIINCKIYLKYHWNTEILQLKNESPNYYIGSDSSFECSNINIQSYWSHINIYDDINQELICTVPYINTLNPIFGIYVKDQTYGTTRGYVYADKICGDYIIDYLYTTRYRTWHAGGFVTLYKANVQGNASFKIVDNSYVSLHNSTWKSANTNCIDHTYGNIAEDYEDYPSTDYYGCYSRRIGHINCLQTTATYDYLSGELVNETTQEDDGYVYYNTNQSNLQSAVRNAILYYNSYLNSTNEIDEEFFIAGNFLICVNDKNNLYYSITTWVDYQEKIEEYDKFPFTIVKKCAKFDTQKFYFEPNIFPDNFLYNGFYNYKNHYFNFIGGSNISLFGERSNWVTGYVKYGEDTKDMIIRHVINDTLPSYSDDYDQY